MQFELELSKLTLISASFRAPFVQFREYFMYDILVAVIPADRHPAY